MSDLRVATPLSYIRSHYNYDQHYDALITHKSGFQASPRKNTISYFIKYIDIDLTKQDICEYIKASKVIPTFINAITAQMVLLL